MVISVFISILNVKHRCLTFVHGLFDFYLAFYYVMQIFCILSFLFHEGCRTKLVVQKKPMNKRMLNLHGFINTHFQYCIYRFALGHGAKKLSENSKKKFRFSVLFYIYQGFSRIFFWKII